MILQYSTKPAFGIFENELQYTIPTQKPSLKSTHNFKRIRDTLRLFIGNKDGSYRWWLMRAAPIEHLQRFINITRHDEVLSALFKKELETRKASN